jgi:hypothetical protein
MDACARLTRLALVASLFGGLLAIGVVPRPALAAPSADADSTLVVIDTPRGGNSGPDLYVAGWAADPGSTAGTGVDRVDVYLDGEPGTGTLLGSATYGLQRPDVVANLGSSRFLLSGYAMTASVSPGPHTVYVYAHPSDQPRDQGWAAPKTAAVVVGGPLAASAGPPGVLQGPGPLSGVTNRLTGITGSYTLGAVPPTGSNYPPGPADTGGPIYQPFYLGAGLYSAPLPFPDYPPYYTPSGFDFSLGSGYDFYSPSYLWNVVGSTAPVAPYVPWRYRWWLNNGPLYCPVYTYSFC